MNFGFILKRYPDFGSLLKDGFQNPGYILLRNGKARGHWNQKNSSIMFTFLG
jgi:hypothetical protein